MLILGIDPGTATSGFALLDLNGKSVVPKDWGLIETDKNNKIELRFIHIYTQMSSIFKKYNPDIMAIEKVFFATNAKTAIAVGQAQGVMFYAAARAKVEIVEYAPGTIKKVVSGNGRSDKKEMQKSLRKIFGARIRSAKHKKTHFDNAADALAVALCHAYTINPKNI